MPGVIRVGEDNGRVIRLAECKGWLDLGGLVGGVAGDARDVRHAAVLAVLPP